MRNALRQAIKDVSGRLQGDKVGVCAYRTSPAVVDCGDQLDEGAPEANVRVPSPEGAQRLSGMRSKSGERRRWHQKPHPPIKRDGGFDVANHVADVLDAAYGGIRASLDLADSGRRGHYAPHIAAVTELILGERSGRRSF
jgi:hypothetical protein